MKDWKHYTALFSSIFFLFDLIEKWFGILYHFWLALDVPRNVLTLYSKLFISFNQSHFLNKVVVLVILPIHVMFSKIQLFLSKSNLQINGMLAQLFKLKFLLKYIFGGSRHNFIYSVISLNIYDILTLFINVASYVFAWFGVLFCMFFLPFLFLLELLFLQSSFGQRGFIIQISASSLSVNFGYDIVHDLLVKLYKLFNVDKQSPFYQLRADELLFDQRITQLLFLRPRLILHQLPKLQLIDSMKLLVYFSISTMCSIDIHQLVILILQLSIFNVSMYHRIAQVTKWFEITKSKDQLFVFLGEGFVGFWLVFLLFEHGFEPLFVLVDDEHEFIGVGS